jgi:hypothetical protein
MDDYNSWEGKFPTIFPYLNDRATVVQANASLGLYPINLSRHFDRVIAFEPMPAAWNGMQHNLENSNAENITTHNRKLTAKDLEELDSLDLLWLDGESDILKEAANTIKRNSPLVIVDSPDSTESAQMERLGYNKIDRVLLSDIYYKPAKAYRVVSFYTPDYAEYVAKLSESVARFGYLCHYKEYPKRRSWRRNTHIKPEFILDCLNEFDEDILWIDADAVIERPLYLFDAGMDADFSFFTPPQEWIDLGLMSDLTAGNRFWTGTMYFTNNANSKTFVKAWLDKIRKHPGAAGDQTLISRVFSEDNLDFKFTELPFEYVRIFDYPVYSSEGVIVHHQASRKFNERRRSRRRRGNKRD